MKKWFCAVSVFLMVLTIGGISANAKVPSSSDYLILGLLSDPINQAVNNYYKDDEVKVVGYHWTNDFKVVEVDSSEKGHLLQAPFVVKVHIQPQNNKGILGTDTLTFGVTPGVSDYSETKIKLLNYDHQGQ